MKSKRKSKWTTTPLSMSRNHMQSHLQHCRFTEARPLLIRRGPPKLASVKIPDKCTQANPTAQSRSSSMSKIRTTRIRQEPTASEAVHQSGDIALSSQDECLPEHNYLTKDNSTILTPSLSKPLIEPAPNTLL